MKVFTPDARVIGLRDIGEVIFNVHPSETVIVPPEARSAFVTPSRLIVAIFSDTVPALPAKLIADIVGGVVS